MEFIAPGTPQQNGIVERSFAFLYNRIRAMLNRAGLTIDKRKKFWAECASMATILDNIHVRKTSSNYEKIFGHHPKLLNYVRGFGEMAVIKIKVVQFQQKLANKGITVMLIGFAEQHPSDTYRFYDFDKRSVLLSRDVTWLNTYHGEHFNIAEDQLCTIEVDTKFYNE